MEVHGGPFAQLVFSACPLSPFPPFPSGVSLSIGFLELRILLCLLRLRGVANAPSGGQS